MKIPQPLHFFLNRLLSRDPLEVTSRRLIQWMAFDGANLLFVSDRPPPFVPKNAHSVWWAGPESECIQSCLEGDNAGDINEASIDFIFWLPPYGGSIEDVLIHLRLRGRVICLDTDRWSGPPQALDEITRWDRVSILRRPGAPLGKAPSVSVIVPTRNEVGNVDAAISEIPFMGSHTEIVFVDGASTDGTWQKVETYLGTRADGATIRLVHQVPPVDSEEEALKKGVIPQAGRMLRLGKGDAVRKGFDAATGDILMILDSDLTVPPQDLPRFYQALVDGEGDLINGSRLVLPMEPGAMRWLNKLGNKGFARLFSVILRQPVGDTLCGTKVLWAEDYHRIAAGRSLLGEDDPFGDFDILLGSARLGLKVSDVPVAYRARTYGQIKIQRLPHGIKLGKVTAKAWYRMLQAGF